ncbi:MAG: flagellar protein FlaG [Kiloniellales bacterium]|nr:flagellar protein FlaG [Kiloniellales bacterium]
MEVKSLSQAAISAQRPKPQGGETRAATANDQPRGDEIRRELTGALAQRVLEDSGIKPQDISKYRVRLDIDDASGRVVAEVRDKESGELVEEVPSRKILRQAQMLQETLGMILDKPV